MATINKTKSKDYKAIPFKLAPSTIEKIRLIQSKTNTTYDMIFSEMSDSYLKEIESQSKNKKSGISK